MRKAALVLLIIFALWSTLALAQTATTATITGTITDQTGAVIANAKLELRDNGTNAVRTSTTNTDGQYIFPGVVPGSYKLTVTAAGFKPSVMSAVPVSVGKSPTLNFKLQVGAADTFVEVIGALGTELQTLDASIGNVITTKMLDNMPSINRDATALLMIQPAAIPGFNQSPGSGESNYAGGAVAGARADQSTFVLDGGDASSNTDGTGAYNTGFIATPRAVVPTPVESLEEFRVATNNQNSSFSRSSGAEVQMVTRRGTNQWHGALYEYHQNDDTNANSWTLNHLGEKKAEMRDNRFGGRLGGPILKDKTFFFVLYEGRHYLRGDTATRLVPTAAMRAGILDFEDASGTVQHYNLNCVATPYPGTGTLIAPSGIDPNCGTATPGGLNPAIKAIWNTLPAPNDFSQGDGLRSAGFTVPLPNITNEHDAVLRLDHQISSKWQLNTVYRFSTSEISPAGIQWDIGGVTPGASKGVPKNTATRPLQPRFLVAGLTSQLTNNLTNDFHFNYLRHWWGWKTAGEPNPASAFSDAAIQVWAESVTDGMVPVNIDTQHARVRTWNGRDFNFTDNLNWMHGKHMLQFGGRWTTERFFHDRDDKVVGGLAQPTYYAAFGGSYSNIDTTDYTPAAITSADQDTWTQAMVSVLGLVDTASVVRVRNASLQAQPIGTHIQQHAIVNAFDLHFADTWKVTPSLTLTYGLNYGVQLPPYETSGMQTVEVLADTGEILDNNKYLALREQAALKGQVYNPTIGFVPVRDMHRKYPFDPDWGNWGPRFAFAWNPSLSNGLLGSLLGDRKTVIRGGIARMFDRVNGVGLIMSPALGVGFGDMAVCIGPDTTGACTGGTDPSNAFRIGINGKHVAIPDLPAITGNMIIPGVNSIYEGGDEHIDVHHKVGFTDSFDLSIQRELPHNMLLEFGYIGKMSRNLYQNVDPNSVPYMFTMGGQKFSTAWDNLARQLRPTTDAGQGIAPAAVTVQPWFESMLGGVSSAYCTGYTSCTQAVATKRAKYIKAGDVTDFWYALESHFVTGPTTAEANQLGSMDNTVSNGIANYNAFYATVRKRMGAAQFDLNYTLSHALDFTGLTQENTDTLADVYNPWRTYGPAQFDRRHTLNALLTYELPFGKGKRFSAGNALDKVIGGWTTSGVYTYGSGLPMYVYDTNSDYGELGANNYYSDTVGMIRTSGGVVSSSVHFSPTISGGFGTRSQDSSGKQSYPTAFANPSAVAGLFRHLFFSDPRVGGGTVRGLGRWNMDWSIAKTTKITESVAVKFDVQMMNVFNHPLFGGSGYFNDEAGTNIGSPSRFGVLNNQFNSPRYIQWGLRVDF